MRGWESDRSDGNGRRGDKRRSTGERERRIVMDGEDRMSSEKERVIVGSERRGEERRMGTHRSCSAGAAAAVRG